MKDRCLLETSVYSWGRNDHGQLGVPKATVANLPQKIELPTEFTLDEMNIDPDKLKLLQLTYIDDIVCGGRYSGLISDKGDLWLCGNFKPKKEDMEEVRKRILSDVSSEPEEKGKKGSKKQKKGKHQDDSEEDDGGKKSKKDKLKAA